MKQKYETNFVHIIFVDINKSVACLSVIINFTLSVTINKMWLAILFKFVYMCLFIYTHYKQVIMIRITRNK